MGKDRKPLALMLTDSHLTKENIKDVETIWDQAIQICSQYGIKRIFHGGDMVTARESQPLNVLLSIKRTADKLYEASIDAEIILGNHDKVNLAANEGYSSIFNLEGFAVHENHTKFESDNLVIHLLSYFPENGNYNDKLKDASRKIVKGKFNLLITHIGINGGLAHSYASTNKEIAAENFKAFDKVLVGHYHNQCQLDGYEIYYTGSTHQQNFGEDENKGFTLIYDNGDHQFIPSEMPRYVTIEKDIEAVDAKFLKEVKRLKEIDGDKIRLIVTGDESKIKSLNKSDIAAAGVSKLVSKSDSVSLGVIGGTNNSALVSFDKAEILKEYKVFGIDQEIDVELGIEYLKSI